MEDYTIWNPVVWGIFIGVNIIIVVAIKLFQIRYPQFPEGDLSKGQSMKIRDVMTPTRVSPDKTKIVVEADESVEVVYPLFLKHSEEYLYVKDQEGSVGIISLDQVLGLKSTCKNKYLRKGQNNESSTYV
ncbi:hypothetical protein [Aneurinibacillus terranovensis]|uniref:hypothetical protein n=1 Tax=Aneurinibacillus terranovensis TaxID=278991 RepID=UPI00041DE494|nr:hypothetical protein [Aneurinibacillus terranovensis]